LAKQHSMAGLREHLFDVLEQLKAGRIDGQTAGAAAKVAQAILKSAEVQMTYERMRLDNELPSVLPEMALSPPLLEKAK
jgi:hypothetical protein